MKHFCSGSMLAITARAPRVAPLLQKWVGRIRRINAAPAYCTKSAKFHCKVYTTGRCFFCLKFVFRWECFKKITGWLHLIKFEIKKIFVLFLFCSEVLSTK
jgi:hypothetical protein